MLVKQDPDIEDLPYGKVIKKFLADSESKVQQAFDECDIMMKKYAEICDFFMFGKNDEVRNKSDKFFAFFIEFFNEVQKNMPKPEVKKAKKAVGMAAKKAGAAAMMAELAAKQAKMGK